jgi:hypothetical protein
MQAGKRRDRIYFAVIALWAVAVIGGMVALWRYKLTPGKTGSVPERWPDESALVHSAELPTLLVFVRPDCPCTRASLGELAILLSHFEGRVATYVVMQRPVHLKRDLHETEYWQRAESLPGVRVVADEHGTETTRFGAGTSGDALLYDASGALRFHGGITGARGHAGDNAGRERLGSLIAGDTSGPSTSPVFGCELEPRAGLAP